METTTGYALTYIGPDGEDRAATMTIASHWSGGVLFVAVDDASPTVWDSGLVGAEGEWARLTDFFPTSHEDAAAQLVRRLAGRLADGEGRS